jgi:hypothetical protein
MNTLPTVSVINHAVKLAARGNLLKDYISGQQTADEVVAGLLAVPDARVLTQAGSYFTQAAIENVPFSISRLMSTTSTIIRAMEAEGHIARDEAIEALDNVYTQLMLLDSGIAAYKGKASPVLQYEDIRLKTQSGDFDLMRSSASSEDMSDLERTALHNGDSTLKDSVSSDEGVFQTGLHSAEDVMDIRLERMVYKRLNYYGTIYAISWPNHSRWPQLVETLASNALNKVEFNTQTLIPKWQAKLAKLIAIDEKKPTPANKRKIAAHHQDEPVDSQKLAAKLARQLSDISNPFNELADASHAHWRVSTVMRFIYRRGLLADEIIERFTGQIDRITQSAHEEAISGRPAVLTRLQTAQGEQREYTLLFGTITEATEMYANTGDDDQFTNDREAFQPVESYMVTVAWYNQVINAVEAERAELNEIYAELQIMENAILPLWAQNEGDMPTTPPLYWNQDGPHYTEATALAAFKKERIEMAEKFIEDNKELSAEALRKAFALLPNGFSI